MPRRSVRIPTDLMDRAQACAEAAKLDRPEWLRRVFAKLDRDGWCVATASATPVATRENSAASNFPDGFLPDRDGSQIRAAIAWAVEFCEARTKKPYIPPKGVVYTTEEQNE